MKKRSSWWLYAVAALTTYIAVSWTVYRFRHPEQTETQLFLNFADAMLWR